MKQLLVALQSVQLVQQPIFGMQMHFETLRRHPPLWRFPDKRTLLNKMNPIDSFIGPMLKVKQHSQKTQEAALI